MQRQAFPTSPIANPKAVIGGTDNLPYRFTILSDGLVRFEYAEDSIFEDRASSFAIHRDLPVPDFELVDVQDRLEISTKKFHLYYDKKPFSANGLSVHVKAAITDWKNLWRYGGGLFEKEYQLHGTARTLDGANGRIPLEKGILAQNGYSSVDDSQSMLFSEDGFVIGRPSGRRSDGYLFVFGHEYKAAMKDFFAVSGSQPLLPRWALGNWWSRYYDYTDKTYLELMDRFKAENLPFSVGVMDMGWHWVFEDKVKESAFNGWTGYSWNTNFFPNASKFLKEMHDRGVKITLNDHPADGVAPYEDKFAEMCKATGATPGPNANIPFDITNRKFLDAYFDVLLRALEDDGVDFWWVDWQQGVFSTIPGVDPLWVLNHYHFLNNSRDNKRPLTFSRFAGPGSHRYPVGFSGDSVVTWETLAFQPEFTATSSNIGYGWWSHDIGGHMQGYRDDELATRWVQHGVFSPILRLHSSDNPWNSKEPWRFCQEARTAMNEALRLRHRLIPYIYSMNVKSARDSEPLIQPIYWRHPASGEAYSCKNTYYFGSELFVAPLTSARDHTRRSRVKAWLPPGRHVDIFSGAVYDGDRLLWFYRGLDDYVVLAEEGGIIPFDAAEKPANDGANPRELEVKVIVGADGSFELYEDNGHGSSVEEVDWVTTPMKFDQQKGSLAIGPIDKESDAISTRRDWTINFITLPESTTIKMFVDGQIQEVNQKSTRQGVTISIRDVAVTSKITVELGQNPQLAVRDPLLDIFEIIDDAQMLFDPKQAIWASVNAKKPLAIKLAQLQTKGYDSELLGAITEYLCSDSRWVEKY